MRVFIAIEIPEIIKGYIAELQEKIDNKNNKIRHVNKNNIHLTLKFLGEVQPNNLEEIKNNLKKITFEPFSVVLNGVGIFPNDKHIRVVWVGLKPEGPVLELQKEIDENLKKLFKKEKNFKPHLTLARVKFIEDKKQFVDKLKKIKVENKNIDIKNFRLIKSTLTESGPIYEDLEMFE
ncbi:MAG: RNA 2',3'-cyclic phosphodiesterase [Candidatus Woesearchaeota archaeon]|jgi:2'-5' RNA ligase|nr:RNA 2',3'-cyclic phosphodiesterase [Candidatus Woesearchaeota archaeon]|tara:strand:+ start:767 stop:1300 length:534 start_codon:yes stop_codon:yes gene_type:complete